MPHRRLALAAFVLVAALPFAACSPKLPDPATAVKAATENAAEAKTVYVETDVDLEGVAAPEDLKSTATAAYDFENDKFWIRGKQGVLESEIRGVDGRVYLRPLASDEWIDLGPSEPQDPDAFAQMLSGGADPIDMLGQLGAKASYARREGYDEIRGEEAVHYVAIVPTSEVDDEAGITGIGGEEVKFELWVNDSGLPVRQRVSFEADLSLLGFDLDPVGPVTFIGTFDFFDYGKPVEVEAPPADKITGDWEDLFEELFGEDDPFGGMGDPFAGADCYGDRVDGCLGVNPELDARAADPAPCQGAEARVCLVPIGNVRTDVVDAIVKFHKETANIDVLVLPSLPMETGWINEYSQVTENQLYAAMGEAYGVDDDTPSTFIGITPIDVVPEDDRYGWMFGARFGAGAQGLNHGVFSYFRMVNVEPYDGRPITDELIHERASKYVGRYVAILHLDYPMGDDIDYLHYSDMFGFSDLDSIGKNWPTGPVPCRGTERLVCIIPDGNHNDPEFLPDVEAAAAELSAELGIRVEVRLANATYYPTKDSWSEEYRTDLRSTIGALLGMENVTVIGFTDDALSQSPSVPDHVDRAWPAERLAIASGFEAGIPGTAQHRARLKAILLRAIAQVHFGKPLNGDPSSLLYERATEPSDLDGKTAPTLP